MALAGDLACVLEAGIAAIAAGARPGTPGGDRGGRRGRQRRSDRAGGQPRVHRRALIPGCLSSRFPNSPPDALFFGKAPSAPGFAEDVATAGSLAFIADGAAGLRIVAVEPGGSGGGMPVAREISLFPARRHRPRDLGFRADRLHHCRGSRRAGARRYRPRGSRTSSPRSPRRTPGMWRRMARTCSSRMPWLDCEPSISRSRRAPWR